MTTNDERCALCGCRLFRRAGTYAAPTIEGRAHATKHHHVAERLFGRSANRRGDLRDPVFSTCPWDAEGQTETFCYECHEVVIHNPVFLKPDIVGLASLVRRRGLDEESKGPSRAKLAGRVQLLHEVIEAGIASLLRQGGAP